MIHYLVGHLRREGTSLARFTGSCSGVVLRAVGFGSDRGAGIVSNRIPLSPLYNTTPPKQPIILKDRIFVAAVSTQV